MVNGIEFCPAPLRPPAEWGNPGLSNAGIAGFQSVQFCHQGIELRVTY